MVPEASSPLPIQRLTEALTSQLAELGVEVQTSTGRAGAPNSATALASSRRDVLAFVWIEGTPDALVIHFYEPAGTSLRERRIPVTDTDAASLEEVAVVVRSAASALLERARDQGPEQIPPPRPLPQLELPPPRPAPAPALALPPRSALFQLSLGAVGQPYAPDLGWQGGVLLAAAWRPNRGHWLLGGAATWFPPVEYRTEQLSLELRRHPGELFVGWESRLADSPISFRAEGGLTLDAVVRRTGRVSDSLELAPQDTRWSAGASTRLRVAWTPTPRLWLFAAGGADFVFNRFDHVLEDEAETPVISPLRVRPRGQMGVALDIW
jgi:hypothetical protein